MTTAPEPVRLGDGLLRWSCADGHVIGDTVTADPGVHLYTVAKEPDRPGVGLLETGRRLEDPAELADALLQAAKFVESAHA